MNGSNEASPKFGRIVGDLVQQKDVESLLRDRSLAKDFSIAGISLVNTMPVVDSGKENTVDSEEASARLMRIPKHFTQTDADIAG